VGGELATPLTVAGRDPVARVHRRRPPVRVGISSLTETTR